MHGGFGLGDRNGMGGTILDFAVSYDLIIANTYFKKREEHLITYKSGTNKSQIDYFLIRKSDRSLCKDCKVILGESLVPQHRILVMDVYIQKCKRKDVFTSCPKTKWWNFKGENLAKFKNQLAKEDFWSFEGEINLMWNKMANCVKKVAKEILGESKGKKFTRRETWWWSKEIQNAIKEKRDYFIAWQKNKNNETLKEYKAARNNTKKLVSEAKSKTFDDLYRKLGTREGEKDIYKLAKQRDKKSKDLNHIRCIKDEDQRVLVKRP